MNDILKTALEYKLKGISMFPLGPDKLPIIKWGKYQEELPTEAEINEWFKDGNDNNIAIITGKISGFTVIDVEKGGQNNYPATLTAKTGGGGIHLYYKYNQELKTKARVLSLTDIRNDGGYVVAPPSTSSKGKYEWKNSLQMVDFPINQFGDNAKKRQYHKEYVEKGIPEFEGADVGNRNDALTSYIGLILPLIHPLDWETKAWEKLKQANQSNDTQLDEDELRGIFESISQKEKDNPTIHKISKPIIDQDLDLDDDDILLMSDVAKSQRTEDLLTYSTGFKKFDNVMEGGFKEGDLIVVTAPTGQGKTTFAQTLTCNMTKEGVPVLFFSYEVLVSNIWKKFEEMGMSKSSVVYSPVNILNGSIELLEKRILNAIDKYGIKAVVIDHLGFLMPRKMQYDNNMNTNYSAFLGNVCRDLKTLSLKNKLVTMLLVHIRKTDKVTLNDIRDSSGIAQESDYVFILERQEAGKGRNLDTQGEDMLYTNDTNITLAKNRITGMTPKVMCMLYEQKFIEKYNPDNI